MRTQPLWFATLTRFNLRLHQQARICILPPGKWSKCLARLSALG